MPESALGDLCRGLEQDACVSDRNCAWSFDVSGDGGSCVPTVKHLGLLVSKARVLTEDVLEEVYGVLGRALPSCGPAIEEFRRDTSDLVRPEWLAAQFQEKETAIRLRRYPGGRDAVVPWTDEELFRGIFAASSTAYCPMCWETDMGEAEENDANAALRLPCCNKLIHFSCYQMMVEKTREEGTDGRCVNCRSPHWQLIGKRLAEGRRLRGRELIEGRADREERIRLLDDATLHIIEMRKIAPDQVERILEHFLRYRPPDWDPASDHRFLERKFTTAFVYVLVILTAVRLMMKRTNNDVPSDGLTSLWSFSLGLLVRMIVRMVSSPLGIGNTLATAVSLIVAVSARSAATDFITVSDETRDLVMTRNLALWAVALGYITDDFGVDPSPLPASYIRRDSSEDRRDHDIMRDREGVLSKYRQLREQEAARRARGIRPWLSDV
jgi:hypothetical protein